MLSCDANKFITILIYDNVWTTLTSLSTLSLVLGQYRSVTNKIMMIMTTSFSLADYAGRLVGLLARITARESVM